MENLEEYLKKGILIGDPVEHSISDQTHNFILRGIATYEKRRISRDRLKKTIDHLVAEGFSWVAVTMPYKEAVIPFLDEIDPQAAAIGSVNTIVIHEGRTIGYNTDGAGAINPIETRSTVQGKTILILGAGGAARAIAYEAKERGGDVFFYNRTYERAKILADQFGVKALNEIPHHYDILIHTTCVGMNPQPNEMAIRPEQILPGAIVMDIVYSPLKTKLLKEAEMRGCQIITGLEMFSELSYLQFALVFDPRITREVVNKECMKVGVTCDSY